MIKDAINRILELSYPNIIEVEGKTFADKTLHYVDKGLRATPIEVKTLSSLISYIKDFMPYETQWKSLLHIVSYREVQLISALDFDRKREVLMVAKAQPPEIMLNRYISNEEMLINVQANFIKDEDTDRAALLKFAGTVTSGSIKEYDDDGVTQKATVKVGVASKIEAIVPSPCLLKPYRTFIEVEQPASQFIFRMREGARGDVESALYESDGGAWKVEAMKNIEKYLRENLEDVKEITIIS
jgi:hypothetical protein